MNTGAPSTTAQPGNRIVVFGIGVVLALAVSVFQPVLPPLIGIALVSTGHFMVNKRRSYLYGLGVGCLAGSALYFAFALLTSGAPSGASSVSSGRF